MDSNQVYILLAILAVANGVTLFLYYRVHKRLKVTLGGTDAAQLEKRLGIYFSKVKEVEKSHLQLIREYNRLADMASLSAQKVSVYRFNPFGDTGGDQSFALAVLDAQNSGYILTSIHGREGTRSYIKPIDYGKSKYTLSKEEQKALDQARKRTPSK